MQPSQLRCRATRDGFTYAIMNKALVKGQSTTRVSFSQYVDTLERLAFTGISPNSDVSRLSLVQTALDGGPSTVLSNSDSIQIRRATGSFFTASAMARRMVTHWQSGMGAGVTYLDPACGAGDLLLAVASRLPIQHSLDATLDLWEEQLAGYDIDHRFVAATKARLVLLARSRSPNSWDISLSKRSVLFPKIDVANGLSERLSDSSDIVRVVMNPPFTMTRAPLGCSWGARRISTAAVFVDYWVDQLPHGSELVAILPDVLRSGSRYQKWRASIEERARITGLDPLMQFSRAIDIDVFLLALQVGIKHDGGFHWWRQCTSRTVVGDLFEVKVGSVVPHRHQQTGPLRSYATTRSLAIGATVDTISTKRRFSGSVFDGPFLTVRRTSRPGERRCGTTLVTAPGSVAVENHLIVLLPNDGCERFLDTVMCLLNSRTTDEWLDKRIRCRHLTVSAVRSIPLDLEGP